MNYLLVYSTPSEIDFKLAEGRLRAAGFDVRSDYTHEHSGKSMIRGPFGLYVPEDDLEKAKAVLVAQVLLPTKNPSAKVSWIMAIIFIAISCMVFLAIKNSI